MPVQIINNSAAPQPLPSPAASKEAEIAARLTSMDQKLDATNALNKIMSNPAIREVMAAEAAGKRIKIVDDKPEAPKAFDPNEVELPEGDVDNKQLFGHLLKATDRMVESRTATTVQKMFGEQIDPINQRIGNLEKFAGESAQQTMKREIDEVSKKYANFDDYRPKMIELSKRAPGLGVEELYKSACALDGKSPLLKSETSSERGSSSLAKKSLREERGKELPKGSQGFNQLLKEGLERQDVSMFSDRR